jgi:hypothetical protein
MTDNQICIVLVNTTTDAQADTIIKKMLGVLGPEEIVLVKDCYYQSVVMSVDMPEPTTEEDSDFLN